LATSLQFAAPNDHVEAQGRRGGRAMAEVVQQLPRAGGVGVRPGARHARGARRGGEGAPGVHGAPLPEEGVL